MKTEMLSTSGGSCCLMNQTNESTTASTNVTVLLVSHTDTVLVAVTAILGLITFISLFLNTLLVIIIQYSPSLRTPPNSHLLNICINNLLLCLDMFLCAMCLNVNSVELDEDRSEVLSGIQLLLTYNSLLQYWGTFASIGYYRYRTIKMPGLTLRCRRQLVSRCVMCNWIISPLLGITLSLSYAQNSRYAPNTLDPFLRDFFLIENKKSSIEELVAVTLVTLLALLVGLGILIVAYYSICRTLNVVSVVGRNRISPRQLSSNLQSDSSDLTLSVGRSYRPQYTFSTPSYIGTVLTNEHQEMFTVMYSRNESSVTVNVPDMDISKSNEVTEHSKHQSSDIYISRRQLTSTNSNASTCSIKSKLPEFTDISIGVELLRFQKQQSNTLQRRQSFKRETISLNTAIRNSLAMLVVYCTCSLPLIVITVPGTAHTLSTCQRLHLLLFCRILFYLNASAYPTWYLLFSVTVKKCFIRLWEGVVIRYRSR